MENCVNCPYCKTPIGRHARSQCLRAWVARDVMGWQVIPDFPVLPAHVFTENFEHIYLLPDLGPQWYPDYEISAAWEIVEKLETERAFFALDTGGWEETVWEATFRVYPIDEEQEAEIFTAHASTAQLAICRAAIGTTK